MDIHRNRSTTERTPWRPRPPARPRTLPSRIRTTRVKATAEDEEAEDQHDEDADEVAWNGQRNPPPQQPATTTTPASTQPATDSTLSVRTVVGPIGTVIVPPHFLCVMSVKVPDISLDVAPSTTLHLRPNNRGTGRRTPPVGYGKSRGNTGALQAHITGGIERANVRMLCDTGAVCSCMSHIFYEHNLSSMTPLHKCSEAPKLISA